MLPHDILVCAHHEPGRRTLAYDCFPVFPVPREAMERLYEPERGFLARVIDAWNAADRTPCSPAGGAAAAGERDADLLARAGMQDFVAHGMPSAHDPQGIETFFCFAQAGGALVPAHIKREVRPIGARHSFLIELLLPYLHATYQRVIAGERAREAPRADAAAAEPPVTAREIEILAWVREGKSNQEIGMLLSISPLTVKNHVQKILRKLGASNRAQAVSKALNLGLIANAA
ncbi:MAG: hypothetical protein JNM90_14370 [Burkholderiales bacterium]|nr:hypothetical protein [Burkholderiales bacterium]